MDLRQPTFDSLQEFLQHDIDEQMDAASVSVLFSGQEIHSLSENSMSRDEWIEFGNGQVQAISDCYGIDYHVISASPKSVTLMSD